MTEFSLLLKNERAELHAASRGAIRPSKSVLLMTGACYNPPPTPPSLKSQHPASAHEWNLSTVDIISLSEDTWRIALPGPTVRGVGAEPYITADVCVTAITFPPYPSLSALSLSWFHRNQRVYPPPLPTRNKERCGFFCFAATSDESIKRLVPSNV